MAVLPHGRWPSPDGADWKVMHGVPRYGTRSTV
jgi:hypothetical protein